jgi:hypothetical protein
MGCRRGQIAAGLRETRPALLGLRFPGKRSLNGAASSCAGGDVRIHSVALQNAEAFNPPNLSCATTPQ